MEVHLELRQLEDFCDFSFGSEKQTGGGSPESLRNRVRKDENHALRLELQRFKKKEIKVTSCGGRSAQLYCENLKGLTSCPH